MEEIKICLGMEEYANSPVYSRDRGEQKVNKMKCTNCANTVKVQATRAYCRRPCYLVEFRIPASLSYKASLTTGGRVESERQYGHHRIFKCGHVHEHITIRVVY